MSMIGSVDLRLLQFSGHIEEYDFSNSTRFLNEAVSKRIQARGDSPVVYGGAHPRG